MLFPLLAILGLGLTKQMTRTNLGVPPLQRPEATIGHPGRGPAALAFVESMQNEKFVISARDSSHKYTPQGPSPSVTTEKDAETVTSMSRTVL